MDTFATAITCIDGRVQQPIADWIKLRFNVRYVDLITEPGPDKELAEGSAAVIKEVMRKTWFSLNHHHSRVVAITGHDTCAANPVSKEEHYAQILEAVEVLISYKLPAQIVGLWLNEWGSVDLVFDSTQREPAKSYL